MPVPTQTTTQADVKGLFRRLAPPMPRDAVAAWVFTALVGALALLVRVANLGWPTSLVFDEAYYVPEAHQLLHYGFEENRAYYFIVHPPFGKWNIAIGEWLFGYNSFGWRISSVVFGTAAIVLLSFVVRRMTRSTLCGLIAAILLAADGFSFALSRIGILDIFLQFWVLLAFWFLILDRDRFRTQLARACAAGDIGRWGPRVGFRWWRLAAGITFGLASSVKWSGVYFLAGFAILCVVWDWGAYRVIGLRRPFVATLRRSLPTALWDLGVVPVLAYLVTWIGWFAGESAQGRYWAEGRGTAYPWIPQALRSLWHMHVEWLNFHTHLTTPHPWQSNPWSWLFTGRPVLLVNDNVVVGGQEHMRTITMIGTPALWWLFALAGLWMIWWVISRMDWRAVVVLVAIAAGWGAWLIDTQRTMFMFYMAPVVPFFVMAVTFGLSDVLGRRTDPVLRRRWGTAAVAVYVAIVVVMFGFFLPVLNGTTITMSAWDLRMWLPAWA